MNVTDAWSIEVFGNTLENGLGSDGTGRITANASAVGEEGAEPGTLPNAHMTTKGGGGGGVGVAAPPPIFKSVLYMYSNQILFRG